MNMLESIRIEKKLSRQALADLAKTSQPQIYRLEDGSRKFTMEWAERLAPHLGYGAAELYQIVKNGYPQPNHSQNNDSTQPISVALSRSRSGGSNPPADVNLKERQYFTGVSDLPIYPSAEAGDGAIIIDTSPIDHIPRPLGLEHEKDAFGVLVVGDCMIPEFRSGEYAFIHPRKPPVKGLACLLTTEGNDDKWLGSLKSFIKSTDTHWIVEQHNPRLGQSKQLKFLKSKWPKCLRVVGKYEGR